MYAIMEQSSRGQTAPPVPPSPKTQLPLKASLMVLPNEILSQILRDLLKDAKIHFGNSQTTIELLTNPYRCKILSITIVNWRLHNLAWAYLNCNCTFTTDHLSKHAQDPSAQIFLNHNGDVKEWKGIMRFKRIAKLTILPHQLINMNSKAKRIHPFLIRFPNLQQLTLQLHEDKNWWWGLRGQGNLEWVVRMTRDVQGRFRVEIDDFLQMPPRHRLLSTVERKVDINFKYDGKEECVATVTKHGAEVQLADHAAAELWKSMWEDVFNIKCNPSKNWYRMWTRGGISYKEWVRSHWRELAGEHRYWNKSGALALDIQG